MPDHGIGDGVANIVWCEWLGQMADDAALETDVGRHVLTGGQDDGGLGETLLDLRDQPVAIASGHPPIDQDHADASLRQHFDRRVRIGCGKHAVVIPAQDARQHLADRLLVVHDEYGFASRHSHTPFDVILIQNR